MSDCLASPGTPDVVRDLRRPASQGKSRGSVRNLHTLSSSGLRFGLTKESINGKDLRVGALAIAGSGAIACGLAAVAATQGHVTVFARSEGSCNKASAKVHAICERLGVSVNGNVHVSRDPAVLRGRHVRRRGDRRGPARQGGDLEAARRAPGRRCRAGHHHVLAGDRRARRGQRPPRALRRPARLQPGAEDGSDRARVPGRGERGDSHAGARFVRGAGQDRGRGARTPGFVVNRLLFPYLFDAVAADERSPA